MVPSVGHPVKTIESTSGGGCWPSKARISIALPYIVIWWLENAALLFSAERRVAALSFGDRVFL